MTDHPRAEVESLFERALDLPASARAAWLQGACPDEGVRAAVQKLLAAHDRAGILERPLSSVAADVDRTLAATPEGDPVPGERVGSYEIMERIGRGGMGVVMRARDTRLDRIVAVKFLAPEAAATPDRRARFAAEARAASALDHPAVARVYDVGETEDGSMYLVMAHCPGRTLDKLVSEGPMDVDVARGIALGIAEGLACAHGAGIIHRDIKPSNVMIGPDGRPKILDFGIAKIADAPAMTRTGMRIGTAAYMSPEQARGERVDPRADVWSLGVVLYEMVTGTRPFSGRTPAATVHAILTSDPVAAGTRRRDLPDDLDRVIRRTLAKARDARYRDISALIADLDPARDTRVDVEARLETLTDEARTVLRRLSLFEGPFAFDEAEAAADDPAGAGPDVLEAMDALLAESLVRRAASVDARSRFVLSPAVREISRNELVRAGEIDALRERLARRSQRGERAPGETNGGGDQAER